MKNLFSILAVCLLAISITACSTGPGKPVPINDTRETASKTFIQALIDNDDEAVDSLNKAEYYYSTMNIMSNIAPKFVGKTINDFNITYTTVDSDLVTLVVSLDGQVKWPFIFKQIG